MERASRSSRRRLREDYFAPGLTAINAYDFGFLLADGNVNRAGNSVSIELADRDRAAIEGMRERFGSDAPIRTRERTITLKGRTYGPHRQVSIVFSSTRLCADLAALGLGPGKDSTVYRLPEVTGPIAAAAVRGVFDGDGTVVRVLTRNPPGAKIVINGPEYVLRWLQATVAREAEVAGTVRRVRTRGTWSYDVIAHDDVSRLADWLYGAPGPCLARKRDPLLGLLREREAGLAARRAEEDALAGRVLTRYRAGMEAADVARELGTASSVVFRIMKARGVRHRAPYRTTDPAQLERVRALREEGLLYREIAARTGLGTSTVRKLLVDADYLARLAARARRDERIRALAAGGRLQREIAAELGCARKTVGEVLGRRPGR